MQKKSNKPKYAIELDTYFENNDIAKHLDSRTARVNIGSDKASKTKFKNVLKKVKDRLPSDEDAI